MCIPITLAVLFCLITSDSIRYINRACETFVHILHGKGEGFAGLTLTVCHRTFSSQFRHLSDQFHQSNLYR